MERRLKNLEENYELELGRAIEEIKKIKKKNPKVMIQLPDGLKPYALEIYDYLQDKTNANIVIWQGTCFGACDIPETDSDLVIQFGHAPWKF